MLHTHTIPYGKTGKICLVFRSPIRKKSACVAVSRYLYCIDRELHLPWNPLSASDIVLLSPRGFRGYVLSVSAGFNHSAAVTSEGAVYVWGKGCATVLKRSASSASLGKTLSCMSR